jgi:hypothetical protein
MPTAHLRLINDPSHAWLEVRAVDVFVSGVTVSDFSYVDRARGMVYLEEDVDLPAYLKAIGAKLEDVLGEYVFMEQEFPGRLGSGYAVSLATARSQLEEQKATVT